jgi:UDP-N-acetylmuramate dehydrogenase
MSFSLTPDAPLRALNTFGVEARAAWLARVETAADLAELVALPAVAGLPVLVLGAGSNVLFTHNVDALVVQVGTRGIQKVGETSAAHLVRVGAGEDWHGTVDRLIEAGWPGLENLALIPGLVGAAPIQNIGAYGLELAERLHSVDIWDLLERGPRTLSLAECEFGYRDSVFRHRLAGRAVILAVTFALPRHWEPRAGYADVAAELAERGVTAPLPRQLFDAVVAIRRRKLPDPATIGNVGSFFKNPIVPREQHAALITHFPSLVSYPLAGGRFKLAAGWLIEACGLKGATRGRAGVYERQALVLVNRGGATGQEILALAREVQDKVSARFGVLLEPEPLIV